MTSVTVCISSALHMKKKKWVQTMQFDIKLSIIILCRKIGRVYYVKGVGDLKLFTTKRAE